MSGQPIWISGHRGMLGRALVRQLEREGQPVLTASRAELDLEDQAAVRAWVQAHRPARVVIAAAKVGGILANRHHPAEFLHANLMIAANIIHAAHAADVQKLLFVASSAAYPREAAQPITEDALLTGPLDPAHEPYAIAKIAGIKLCEAYRRQYGRDFIAAVPTNLYGPGDSFDPVRAHVLPALIRKAHEAKLANAPALEIWGTGRPRRDLLHVDDCASACLFLLDRYTGEAPVNIGSGEDIAIADLARLVCDVVGYHGPLTCDESKPDGTLRKLLSGERLAALGWQPRVALREGIAQTYAWFLEQEAGNAPMETSHAGQ